MEVAIVTDAAAEAGLCWQTAWSSIGMLVEITARNSILARLARLLARFHAIAASR